jgi:hypothetical protein
VAATTTRATTTPDHDSTEISWSVHRRLTQRSRAATTIKGMVVMGVRRVEAVSSGVRVGRLVYAGDALGVDWLGREVREATDVVVVSVDRYADGWLIGHREVRVRQELAPAS